MADDLTQKIMSDYPSFAFLLTDPEIGPLLLEAVDPNKGFDAATFQAKLLQTSWWKNTSAPQRQWLTLVNTDPAQANLQRQEYKRQLLALQSRLGTNLPMAQIDWLTEQSLGLGQAVTDPAVRAQLIEASSGALASGDVASTSQALTKIARNEYLLPITDVDAASLARRVAAGDLTEAGVRDHFARVAAANYTQYADRINAGFTPGEILAPVRGAIANELELGSADAVDLLDPRWSKVLGVPDKSGQIRPMTISEATVYARSQPEWSKTAGARQQGADFTSQLLHTFGAIA